ncbi:MAG TPA: tryptophan synthase subunit alpha [Chitinophagaceae bacterium]
MNRIDRLFAEKKDHILNIYCTAGFPELGDTREVVSALQAQGADMIEIGIPFSDPLADGPVIQQSGKQALENGMTLNVLFEQLKDLRPEIRLPVLLMGYLNVILQYGVERFVESCAAAGIDGVILPDLPPDEYKAVYEPLFKKHNIHFIFLITPETTEERIRMIDRISSGFIYMVSSSSTTGKSKDLSAQEDYFKRIHRMQLRNPALVGFGIHDHESFELACKYANGAIIGSAYIKALQSAGEVAQATGKFIQTIIS